jgi:hypothetical protein
VTPCWAQVIAREEAAKKRIEHEDAAHGGPQAHAARLHGCGVRVDFLLALTFELQLWDWKTAEVKSPGLWLCSKFYQCLHPPLPPPLKKIY